MLLVICTVNRTIQELAQVDFLLNVVFFVLFFNLLVLSFLLDHSDNFTTQTWYKEFPQKIEVQRYGSKPEITRILGFLLDHFETLAIQTRVKGLPSNNGGMLYFLCFPPRFSAGIGNSRSLNQKTK